MIALMVGAGCPFFGGEGWGERDVGVGRFLVHLEVSLTYHPSVYADLAIKLYYDLNLSQFALCEMYKISN